MTTQCCHFILSGHICIQQIYCVTKWYSIWGYGEQRGIIYERCYNQMGPVQPDMVGFRFVLLSPRATVFMMDLQTSHNLRHSKTHNIITAQTQPVVCNGITNSWQQKRPGIPGRFCLSDNIIAYFLLGRQPTTKQKIINTIKNTEYPTIPDVTAFNDIIRYHAAPRIIGTT